MAEAPAPACLKLLQKLGVLALPMDDIFSQALELLILLSCSCLAADQAKQSGIIDEMLTGAEMVEWH